MHPEVHYKPLFITMLCLGIRHYIISIVMCDYTWISLLIMRLLYAVTIIIRLVLTVIIAVSDNLPAFIKQQPTNWLRDFTQSDSNDDAYLNWLTGFIEGDGSFPNNTRGDLTFHISQSLHNFPVILLIKMRLGFGKIRFQMSEGMCHYVIEDHATLIKLCELLNGRFCTTAKLSAFNILVHALNTRCHTTIPILGICSVMNYNWLAEFTDADGSFFVSIAKNAAMLVGFQVTLNTSWTQRDRQVLDFINSVFRGTIVFNKATNSYNLTVKWQDTISILLSVSLVIHYAALNDWII